MLTLIIGLLLLLALFWFYKRKERNILKEKESCRQIMVDKIQDKEKEICQLQEEKKTMNRVLEDLRKYNRDSQSIDTDLKNSDIYKELVRFEKQGVCVPEDSYWDKLDLLFMKEHHVFFTIIHTIEKVNSIDIRVCELTRMGFKPARIAVLLNCEKTNISNVRTRLHKKLFGKDGTGKELDEYLMTL